MGDDAEPTTRVWRSDSDTDNGSSTGDGSTGSLEYVDPGEFSAGIVGGDIGNSGRKRRSDAGKPRGPRGTSQASPRNQKDLKQLDLSVIEGLLFTVHFAAAIRLDTPEFALSEEEAKLIAQKTAQVARHYDFFQRRFSQKHLDIVALGDCLFKIYGPRVVVLWQKAHAPKQVQQNANVVNMRPMQNSDNQAAAAPPMHNSPLPQMPAGYDPNKGRMPGWDDKKA